MKKHSFNQSTTLLTIIIMGMTGCSSSATVQGQSPDAGDKPSDAGSQTDQGAQDAQTDFDSVHDMAISDDGPAQGAGDAANTTDSGDMSGEAIPNCGPAPPTPTGVKASTFGYDAANATAALVAAFNSDEPAIIIDGDMGSTWLVDPMIFWDLSDKIVFIEDGVTIQARPGQFDADSAMMFRFYRASNVQIYGYGATLRMLRDEEFNAEDMSGEWRHTFGLYGVSNFLIEGVSVTNSGGDAFYVADQQDVPSRDVSIHHVKIDGARRQGLSVISVDGLNGCDFECRDVRGRYPMAGIDFEPNEADQVLTRVVLDHIRLEQNARTGIFFALSRMNKTSTPVDIQIRNLYLKDNWIQEAHYTENMQRSEIIMTTGPTGKISFEDVYIDGSQQGFLYNRSDADGVEISFKNVVARDLNTRADSWGPIGFEVRDYSEAVLPMGNTSFENVHVSSQKSEVLFTIRGSNTGTNLLRDLTGEIHYLGEFGELLKLISLDGEENSTLVFTPATSLPSRQTILGW